MKADPITDLEEPPEELDLVEVEDLLEVEDPPLFLRTRSPVPLECSAMGSEVFFSR